MTRVSVSRGKKPGRRIIACFMRSRGTTRSSVISLRASSSSRLDSVSERAVSEGWMGHGRTNQERSKRATRHRRTFKSTPSTSLMPKKFRRLRSTLSAAELLRWGRFDEKIQCIASVRGGALGVGPAEGLRWTLVLVFVRMDESGDDGGCDWRRCYAGTSLAGIGRQEWDSKKGLKRTTRTHRTAQTRVCSVKTRRRVMHVV